MDPKSHLDSSWRPYVAILASPGDRLEFQWILGPSHEPPESRAYAQGREECSSGGVQYHLTLLTGPLYTVHHYTPYTVAPLARSKDLLWTVCNMQDGKICNCH